MATNASTASALPGAAAQAWATWLCIVHTQAEESERRCPAMATKASTASRLFGSAMAGVQNPPAKAMRKAASFAAGPRVELAMGGPPATGSGASATANNSKVRGRGPRTYIASAPEAPSGPARSSKESSRLGKRKWSHDQYTGPPPVGSSVFVRNLPKGATENQVAALFACIGELVDVQVDNGPLPTATVGFVRQDAAFKASQRFHGHWLQGEQLKVSLNVTGAISSAGPEEDDEFWRRELLEMSIRRKQSEDQRQQLKLSQHGDGDDSRGKPPAADDEFWREELAEMRKRQSSNGRSSNGHSQLQSVVIESDDDDYWLEELAQMKRRRRHIGGMEKAVSVGQPSHLGQRQLPVRQ